MSIFLIKLRFTWRAWEGDFSQAWGRPFRCFWYPEFSHFSSALSSGCRQIVTKRGCILRRILFSYSLIDKAIDVIRSIPFIILMVLLIPASRALVGTGSGVKGAYVASIAGTVPFFARQIESVLADVDRGRIEASQAMGFSPVLK